MNKKSLHAIVWVAMIVFFSIMVLPFGCGSSSDNGGSGGTETGSVTGTVLDENGNPVESAICSIDTGAVDGKGIYTDETDANGNYVIAGVPTGSWTMNVNKSGYLTITVTITVNEGQTTEVPSDQTVIQPGSPTPTASPTVSPTTSPTISPQPTGTVTPTPTPSSSPGGGGGGAGDTPYLNWKWQNPTPQGDYQVRGYFAANGIHIFIGNNGMLYRSADNGVTWTKLNSGVAVRLNALWGSADGTRWFAVGDNSGGRGTVLYSSDSGVTWTAQTHANIPNISLYGVYGASDGTKVFVVGATVGGNGTVLYSPLGDGSDWVVQTGAQTGTGYLYDVWSSNDGSIVYAVGALGTVLRSANSGTNWTQCVLAAGPGNPVPNVIYQGVGGDAVNNNRVFVVGAGGTVLYSPGGLQNDLINLTGGAVPNVDLISVYVYPTASGADVFACGPTSGGNGTVVFSDIGDGSDFVNQSSANTGQQLLMHVFGIPGAPNKTIIAGGNSSGAANKDTPNGIIAVTVNAGTTWTQNTGQANHVWTQLNSASAASANNVITVGERNGAGNGISLITANGGTTWTLVDTGAAQALNDVWYATAGTDAYAVGDAGTSLRYNGAAWADNNTAGLGGHNYFGIAGFDANEIYAVGYDGVANGRAAVKLNGGNWTAINLGTKQLNDVAVSNLNGRKKVYVVGEDGTVFSFVSGSTFTAGSWTNLSTGITATDELKSVWAYMNEIYIVGDDAAGNGVFYYSVDDGTTWHRNTSNFTNNGLKSIWGNAYRTGLYAVGDNGSMFFYNPAVGSWTALNANKNITIKDLRCVCGYTTGFVYDIFMVGDLDTILKNVR